VVVFIIYIWLNEIKIGIEQTGSAKDLSLFQNYIYNSFNSVNLCNENTDNACNCAEINFQQLIYHENNKNLKYDSTFILSAKSQNIIEKYVNFLLNEDNIVDNAVDNFSLTKIKFLKLCIQVFCIWYDNDHIMPGTYDIYQEFNKKIEQYTNHRIRNTFIMMTAADFYCFNNIFDTHDLILYELIEYLEQFLTNNIK
jgi:hypothetical protein